MARSRKHSTRRSKHRKGIRYTRRAGKSTTRHHKRTEGSRAEVMHGTALRTSGGLHKKDLMYNKHGRIVSRAKVALARKQQHLKKAGYSAKKGKFGYIRIEPATGKRTRRHRK